MDLKKIQMLLHSNKGVDFSYYKQTTIHRRIMRRLALNRLKSIDSYVKLLKENKPEMDALYQDLLITVTDFFRDTNLYHAFQSKILPALFKKRKSSDPIRIWIPGCATGEEAISFAILLMEYLGEKVITTQVNIFATDINEKSIERARAGIYSKDAVQNVSPLRLKKYFVKVDDHYQVIKAIRYICIFAPHNLLKDPPFSRMDVISCQNVLIYLEGDAQNRIMHSFHYALKSSGFLLLGKSETIGSATSLFELMSKHYKIYSKKPINTPLRFEFSHRSYLRDVATPKEVKMAPIAVGDADLEKEADKILLTKYVPASILINKEFEILRFRGTTTRYLEPSSGKASLHLLKMIKEELSFELRTVIHRAKKENRPVKKEGVIFNIDDRPYEISIEVLPSI